MGEKRGIPIQFPPFPGAVTCLNNRHPRALPAFSIATLMMVTAAGPAAAAPAEPELLILTPASVTFTDEPSIMVTGNVTPGASVSVNGLLVEVDANGSWAIRITLAEGPNTIQAHAWDTGGAQNYTSITVTYNNTFAGLEADLGDAMDEINATQEDLSRTQDQLAEAEADLADALAEIDELKNNLTVAETTLGALQRQATGTPSIGIATAVGQADKALMLGLLGVALGAGGLLMSFIVGRTRRIPKEPED